MNIGDIVTRKSYHNDIPFIIKDMTTETVLLSGLKHRLIADAALSDLTLLPYDVNKSGQVITETSDALKLTSLTNTRGILSDLALWFHTHNDTTAEKTIWTPETIDGSSCHVHILHIDGNKRYLNECIREYKKHQLPITGYSICEEQQPQSILALLKEYQPGILVITGHDSIKRTEYNINDLDSYLNSKYFAESVRIARSYNSNINELVIIAGGCKSHYEALLEAGANFASSPSRVLINVTEPVHLACIIATTPPNEYITMDTIETLLPTGIKGFGGIETRGQCNLL